MRTGLPANIVQLTADLFKQLVLLGVLVKVLQALTVAFVY